MRKAASLSQFLHVSDEPRGARIFLDGSVRRDSTLSASFTTLSICSVCIAFSCDCCKELIVRGRRSDRHPHMPAETRLAPRLDNYPLTQQPSSQIARVFPSVEK